MYIDPFTITALVAMFSSWLFLPQSGHPSALQQWLSGPVQEFDYQILTYRGLVTRRWSNELRSDVAFHFAVKVYEKPLADFVITPTTTVTVTVTPTPTPLSVALAVVHNAKARSRDLISQYITSHLSQWLSAKRLIVSIGLALIAAIIGIRIGSKASSSSFSLSPKRKPPQLTKRRLPRTSTIVYKNNAESIALTHPLPPSPPSSPLPHPVVLPSLAPPPVSPILRWDLSAIATQFDIDQPAYVIVPALGRLTVDMGTQTDPAPNMNQPNRGFDPNSYGNPRASGPKNRNQAQPPRQFRTQAEQNAFFMEEFQRRLPKTGQQHHAPSAP